MARHSIGLTPEETELRAGIQFDIKELSGDFLAVKENGRRVASLMALLIARDAIPKARWEYWVNPTYNHGRIKASRKGIFERNGNRGDEIYEHPHFLPYLRYMLDGASLPPDLIDRFSDKVEDCGQVSGSDALELGEFARQEVKRYGLSSYDASEEFYRLALDCGVYQGHANRIRERVYKLRWVP